MAVKYVKDFAFDSGFGFSGSSGKTPVRAYMRGGAVKSNPTKAPSIAPAMVEKRSQGLGGLTKETKKLAPYNKPHMEGKKGAKVATYAKGGAVKKAHAKKEMPSFLKAKMMKKAEGGPVAEITEGDGMSPLQAMAMPMPEDEGRIVEERMLPSLPPGYEPPSLGGDLRDLEMIGRPVPIGNLTPLPEEPIYVTAFDGPNIAEEDPNRYREMIADMQQPMLERIITKEMRPGYIRPRADDLPPVPVATRMAPQDRRAMRADRNEMAREIMDRYIGGPRRAMGARGIGESRARRVMPVAPRKPMIDRSMPQPYMPTYDPSKRVAPPDFVASPEARFAKGGKVSKGEKKIGKVMGEFKRGELHSGSKKGPVVTNPKQATAIALSEARAAGAKIPKKKAMGGKACG